MDKHERDRMMMLRVWHETVQYYGDPKRRGLGADGACRYYIDEWAGSPAKMCAVGRCMKDPARVAKDYPYGIDVVRVELGDQFQNLFLTEYQGLPVEFWEELQRWHDHDGYFDKQGLTPEGEDRARTIKLIIETGGFA